MNRFLAIAAAVAVCGFAPRTAAAADAVFKQPPPGVTGACRIVEVYDGDTVTVEFTVRARVRLVDCWADEIRTTDDAEKVRGLAARDHLAALCGMTWDDAAKRWTGSTPAVLFSPFTGDGDMGSLFTMSRLVGRLWLSDGKRDLSALQIKAGHAFASKSELEARKAAKPPRP
jgi:endonuclease YncB( thermonuclease family)